MRKRWVGLLLILIVGVALFARLVPYASSPYPYNVDGYPLVRGAERAVVDGRWDAEAAGSALEAYNSKMPAFTLMLAEMSLTLGIEPMRCIQLMTAVLGAACVLLGYALTKRLTGSDAAALGCAAFLALHGFFVYATVAAWKESLGFVLLLAVFLLFDGRDDPRKRHLLALALLLLPLTHHLSTLVGYAFVLAAMCADNAARWHDDRLKLGWLACEVATFAVPAGFAYSYYVSVDMEFFSDVNNLNDAALLGSAIFLAIVVAVMLALPAMSKPWFFFDPKPGKASVALLFDEKSLALLAGYGALWANSRMQLFPGTQFTSDALLVGIAPLVPVYLLAIAGFNLVRYSKGPSKITLVAMGIAPLFLMLFTVSRAYDATSFFVAYRLLDYIDPFMAVGAGAGLAYLAAKAARRFGKATWRARGTAVALGATFVVLVACTTPLAYDWERVFDVSSETKPQQFAAMSWASDAGVDKLSTDQWNADIAAPYFEIQSDMLLPYHLQSESGYGDMPALLEEEWLRRGGQSPLSGRITVMGGPYERLVGNGDLVCMAGPQGDMVLIVLPRTG